MPSQTTPDWKERDDEWIDLLEEELSDDMAREIETLRRERLMSLRREAEPEPEI